MTDQTPFTPPGGATPPHAPPAPFTPPAPPAPFTPPPGPPTAAPPPPRRRLKPGAIVAIVAGSVIVLGGIVAGLVAVTSVLTEAIKEGAPIFGDALSGEPLVTGDKASPVAVEPMDCGGCFTDNDIGWTIVDPDELDAVGLISTLEPWTDYVGTYGDEEAWLQDGWDSGHGKPDECYVTFPQAPVSMLELPPVEDDGSLIAYTGLYADDGEWSNLSQAVRVFEKDEDAVAYMAGLSDVIAACTHYENGSGDSHWEADVTPAPALKLPPSVAALGWVEQTDYDSRYYAFDVQRGNMVVRTALSTGDEISELEFRALVEHVALQLADLTPAG